MKEPHTAKSLIIQTDRQKSIALVFRYPDREFSLSEFAKEAGIMKANTGAILKELKKMGLIEIEELSKIWRVRANQSSQTFRNYKTAFNLFQIYESGLTEFLNDIYSNPRSIILFGSFRKGEDVTESDIDIAIESDEKLETPTKDLKKYEEFLGRKIQIHIFNKKTTDENLFNNISNGIVLSGFLGG